MKEMESLVEDTKARVPVSLERSRLLRSSVPDRILQPRPVLTLRMKDDGTQEVECRCTLQGFKTMMFSDHVVHKWSSDDLAVNCFVSFCPDNRKRETNILC